MKQKLPTLPEHLSSPPVLSGVRVTISLVLFVCFVDRCLSFCSFSFGNCVFCSPSIYGIWLPLWFPQTLLIVFGLTWPVLEPTIHHTQGEHGNYCTTSVDGIINIFPGHLNVINYLLLNIYPELSLKDIHIDNKRISIFRCQQVSLAGTLTLL
jgi:hypothetical protein